MGELLAHVTKIRRGYSWLGNDSLDLLAPLDTLITKALKPWRKGPKVGYLLYNFQSLLSDVGELLERCLAYRREYNELQASAIRQVMDYELFNRQLPVLWDLDKAEWTARLREIESNAQKRSAEVFEDERAPLSAGFAELSRSSEAVSRQAAVAEKKRKELVDKRWLAIQNHQRQLMARHTEPGHPLNFLDRAERILEMLLEDFKEAADKAAYARWGLKAYLSLEEGDELLRRSTYLESDRPLDDFVRWTRHTIREVERTLQWDLELKDTINFGSYSPSSVFYLNRPSVHVAHRMRGFGASLMIRDDVDMPDPQHLVADLRIITDKGTAFGLEAVGPTQANSIPAYHQGRPIFNYLPDGQMWNYEVNGLRHTTKPKWADANHLLGLRFHLVYVCRPEKMDVDIYNPPT